MKTSSTVALPDAIGQRAAPVVVELSPAPDVEYVFRSLASLPHVVFLDSALRDTQLGRYSFLAADPFDFVRVQQAQPGALAQVADRMARFAAPTVADLPPFQGGAAGLLSYDLAHAFEDVARPRFDEFAVPALAVGLYDVVVAFDHQVGRAWIISQGFPETEPAERLRRARERAAAFQTRIAGSGLAAHGTSNGWIAADIRRGEIVDRIAESDLCPQHKVPGPEGLTSNFSQSAYLDAVQHAIDYICAGDVFQVNLSQRLLYPAETDAVELYLRLRRRNAATFAGFFDTGSFQICSASPERFLQLRGDRVEARPIKGTRGRLARPETDLYVGQELMASEKDRAENVMIVDLLRNDISRVCRAESVHVADLCRLESYAYVQHLVSSVRGTLREGCGPFELLAAAFPGGSITGAPKVRAMEIIAGLEPTARGAYCGSLGYVGFNGSMDTSILIRTITAGRGWWQLPVGGGIVAQSSPEAEYAETWQKAAGLLRALEP